MALAFRSCDHARSSLSKGKAGAASRQQQINDLRAKFLTTQKGAEEAPLIPSPSIFVSLHHRSQSGAEVETGALPTIAECAVHLELLEAFVILRQKVLSSNALDRAFGIAPKDTLATVRGRRVRKPDNTFAERRKAKWPIYLRLAAARFLMWWLSSDGGAVSEKSLPPLDVLMIWHAFLLNTESYRKVCINLTRRRWLDIKFPWNAIHNALHDNNRSFRASANAEALFATRVGKFDLFSTLSDHTSHPEDLRLALAGMVPPSSANVAPEIAYPGLQPQCLPKNQRAIAAALAVMAERQAKFAEKMADLLWLRGPALGGTLRRAVVRYENFIQLFGEENRHSQTLVPTLDIDLAWHTHQCSPALYAAACRRLAGREAPIDHNDQLGQAALKDGLGATRRLYEARFKDEYNSCLCWECEELRSEMEVLGDADADANVDLEKVVAKVRLRVEYHKAVELARRSDMPLPALPKELKT